MGILGDPLVSPTCNIDKELMKVDRTMAKRFEPRLEYNIEQL